MRGLPEVCPTCGGAFQKCRAVHVGDPLPQQLRGRAQFLRDGGEIKSPELMERAASAIEARRATATQIGVVGDESAVGNAETPNLSGQGSSHDA